MRMKLFVNLVFRKNLKLKGDYPPAVKNGGF